MSAAKENSPVKSFFRICDYAVDKLKYVLGNDRSIGTSGEVIKWGQDNELPVHILEQYYRNVYLGSIVNKSIDYIMGGGLKLSDDMESYIRKYMARDLKKESVQYRISNNEYEMERRTGAVNMKGDSLQDVVARNVKDKFLFGTFASYLQPNNLGTIAEIEYRPASRIRLLSGYKYCKYYAGNNTILRLTEGQQLPLFSCLDSTEYGPSIYFYHNEDDLTPYPLPHFFAALESIEVDSDITTYNKNTLKNGFNTFTIITIPKTFGDDEKDKLYENLKENNTGVRSEKFLIVEDDGAGQEVVRISNVTQEDIGTRFSNLEQSGERRIFTGANAPKQLFGNQYETTGFNEQEYSSVFQLYLNDTIYPFRQFMIDEYSYIFGIKNPFEFIPSRLEEKLLLSTTQNTEDNGL